MILISVGAGCLNSSVDDPEQKDMYDKFQAMKRYHRRYGQVRPRVKYV